MCALHFFLKGSLPRCIIVQSWNCCSSSWLENYVLDKVIVLIHCKLIEHVNQIGQNVGQVNFLFREMCSCSLKILSSNWISVFIENNLTVGAFSVVFPVKKRTLNSICLPFLYRFWFLKWASRNIWGIKESTILHC